MCFDRQARSQPVFSGKPEGPFCLSCTFIFRNERNWMKKSVRVSEKLVSPGLPGLQVATRLIGYMRQIADTKQKEKEKSKRKKAAKMVYTIRKERTV